MRIESRKNSHLLHAHKIWADKKYREQSGLIWIEGIHLIEEAIFSNCQFESIIIVEERLTNPEIKGICDKLKVTNVSLFFIPEKIQSNLFETKTPQGIGALIKRPHYLPQMALEGALLFLDGIQDPGNVGTLIRSAEAANVSRIYLLPETADCWSGKVIRSSMGSVFRIPIQIISYEKMTEIKSLGYTFVGADIVDSTDYRQSEVKKNTALILGSEGGGLSDKTKAEIDIFVQIPMKQTVDSLNVAVAGSILMFHFFGK